MNPIIVFFTLTLVSLSGCAKDSSLAPPQDGDRVTVTLKVPTELEAESMRVMYRSTVCTFTDHSAYGTPYKRDGYQRMDVIPVRLGQSDLFEAKLPIDGGGVCQWRLSNVTFGVAYKHPTRFGEGVTYGAGGGVVVIFDHNNSPRGGANIKVEGDLIIKKDYYPWLHEKFLGGYEKYVNLAGDGGIYLMYEALRARKVYFEPVLHSDYIISSQGSKVHKIGDFIRFTYPDGSSEKDPHAKPNFRKLEAIRSAAESKP